MNTFRVTIRSPKNIRSDVVVQADTACAAAQEALTADQFHSFWTIVKTELVR